MAPGGHHVVSAEDSRGPVLPDSSSRQASAALSTVGSHSLMCRVSAGQAVGLGDFQKGPVPLSQYIGGEAPCQHGDVPMTPADQVLQRLADPAVFVRHHAGNVQSLDAVVYQYHGQIPILELCDISGRALPPRITPSTCLFLEVLEAVSQSAAVEMTNSKSLRFVSRMIPVQMPA